jgi:hypothetical protein
MRLRRASVWAALSMVGLSLAGLIPRQPAAAASKNLFYLGADISGLVGHSSNYGHDYGHNRKNKGQAISGIA